MKLVGVVLMILGILGLIYAGISYDWQKTVLDVGGIKATVTEKQTVPIAPVVGAISLIGGVALLVIRRLTL